MSATALIYFIDYIEGKYESLPLVCSHPIYDGVLVSLTEHPALRAQLRVAADLILEHNRLVFMREKLGPSRKGRMQSHTIEEVNEQIYTLIPRKDQAIRDYEMMRRLWAFDVEGLKIKG